MVLKTLGAERTGSAGTSLAGAESIEELLRELGLHRDGTRIENGSGLFDANRVSAAQVAGVLRAMASDPRTSSEFIAHLAIGGVDGTLRSRFKAHAASRRVRAKTGTLRATIALSGYVLPRVGSGPAVFSVLVDGLPGQHAEAKQKIDAIVERTLLLLDAQS
jgi:D-alanyl-D-alanine carboxypeptidase/D-alanyl-D-alanine-endopeptidase (penicillin-binding protein 4)